MRSNLTALVLASVVLSPSLARAEDPAPPDPFAFADFSWVPGNAGGSERALQTKYFTGEIRIDTAYHYSFNHPKDDTLGGSTEVFRANEVSLTHIGFGGDFSFKNVQARIMTQFGLYATTTPRNDASPGRGQWDLSNAYRYFSEAYGGYHIDALNGVNIQAGLFLSYIGLWSFYNFDNWTYQPSFVSSNTPWYFNGMRIQWFPTNKLKIEPWIINGWQTYNKTNGHLGLGGQILWMPKEWLKLVFNNYGNGEDTLNVPGRSRIHTDNSIEIRYYNQPDNSGISGMAFSLTGDLGCEYGAGVVCMHQRPFNPVTRKGGFKQTFAGWMLYNRVWLGRNHHAITLGGGRMNNPGRYLTLLPPINGATAVTGSPYFPENPGLQAHMYDGSLNYQWMPREHFTWWLEGVYRHSDIPYWTGRGGITPPGGNNGVPTQFACNNGAASGATDLDTAITNCSTVGGVFFPDMRRGQATIATGILIKF